MPNNPYMMQSKHTNTMVPYVYEREAGHTFTSDIISRLVKDRIVFVSGEIHQQMADIVIAQLLFLQNQDPHKEIVMHINSPGGSVDAGMAIIDTMNYVSCPVRTIAMGMAASMGSMILAAGEPGMRQALPHCNIMIHQPLGGGQGQQTDVEIAARQLRLCREMISNFLVEHSATGYLTKKNIDKELERDNYLTPAQAVEYGIIDSVVEVSKKNYRPKK